MFWQSYEERWTFFRWGSVMLKLRWSLSFMPSCGTVSEGDARQAVLSFPSFLSGSEIPFEALNENPQGPRKGNAGAERASPGSEPRSSKAGGERLTISRSRWGNRAGIAMFTARSGTIASGEYSSWLPRNFLCSLAIMWKITK